MVLAIQVIIGLGCESRSTVEQSSDTLIKAYTNTQQLADKASLQNLRESIRAFSAAYGRFPSDLKELGEFTGVTMDGNRYEYNPSTGRIAQKE